MSKKTTIFKKLTSSKPFNADNQLKTKLSMSMGSDANDLNWKASILLNNIPHYTRSYFGKVYVDIIMGIESSLKSLIISLSKKTDSPETIYTAARSKGHKIADLYSEVEKLAKNRIKLLDKKDLVVLGKAKTLTVNNRYDLINVLLYMQEDSMDRILRTDAVSSVLNEKFLHELIKVSYKLSKIANAARSKYCDFPGMMGSDLLTMHNRIDSFYKAMKHKL